MENRKYMTVAQMGEMLGLKKTDRYWLVHKNKFETKQFAGKTMVVVESFEKWYANQVKYHKVCGTEPGLELRKHSYSARDISILLNVCEQTAYDLIKRNRLETILVEGWKRVPKREFDKWLAGQSRYTLHDFSHWELQRKPKGSMRQEDDGTKTETGNETSADRTEIPANGEAETGDSLQHWSPGNITVRNNHPGYFSRREAAGMAGVSEMTIYLWAEKGFFSQRKVGKKIYIPEDEFKTWIKGREEKGEIDGSALGKKR